MRFASYIYRLQLISTQATTKPGASAHAQEWERIMNINARGLFFSQRAEVGAMLQTKASSASDGFSIVNISSIGGLRALAPYSSPYVPSKHAVIGLTKSAGSLDHFPV